MSRYGPKCTAKTGQHSTHSGEMRCPVHRVSAIRNQKGFPAAPVSAVPQRGRVHEDSGLPFNTGIKVKPKHHNVGQEMLCPESMTAMAWGGTWFEGVTIKPDISSTRYNTRISLSTLISRSHSGSPLYFRDCKVDGAVDFSLSGSSLFERVTAEQEDGHSRSTIEAEGKSIVDQAEGFGAIRATDDAVVRDSRAVVIEADKNAVVQGCQADDQIRAKGNATIIIEHPNQWVFLSQDFTGTVEEKCPALITKEPEWEYSWGGEREYKEEDVPDFPAIRAQLMRRKQDDSEGLYLHPHNQSAWDMLREHGVTEVNSYDEEHDEYDFERYEIDEDTLALALKLHPNPAT